MYSVNVQLLTWFFWYSSIARYAESVNFTKINSLFSLLRQLCDSPYEMPVQRAAILLNKTTTKKDLTPKNRGWAAAKRNVYIFFVSPKFNKKSVLIFILDIPVVCVLGRWMMLMLLLFLVAVVVVAAAAVVVVVVVVVVVAVNWWFVFVFFYFFPCAVISNSIYQWNNAETV